VNERVGRGEAFEDAMRGVLSGIAARELEQLWARLRTEIEEEVRRDGMDPARLTYQRAARVLYTGMLDDLEVDANGGATAEETLAGVISRFEDTFERIYARAAKSSDFGCTITRAIVTSHYETVKPRLEEGTLVERVPAGALLGERRIYYDHRWHEAAIYDMDRLVTGNVVDGPAVLVAPATTVLVPPAYRLFLDHHRVFWAVRPGEDIDRYRRGVHSGRH
jgi:N-methylhydantoinase A/oxoprolinase/acetone carboxylase beta subunit